MCAIKALLKEVTLVRRFLDRQLCTFAVHHRAVDEKKLNEGVLLKEIQAATAQ